MCQFLWISLTRGEDKEKNHPPPPQPICRLELWLMAEGIIELEGIGLLDVSSSSSALEES